MMTKEEAEHFKARWKLVNDFTDEEARRTPPEVRLRQTALLYEAAQTFGWSESLREGEDEVRERWRLLKEIYRV
ncbi:MAG TPA: hypothetical protein VF297_14970 [Pyrinomonadaceae bacterium]